MLLSVQSLKAFKQFGKSILSNRKEATSLLEMGEHVQEEVSKGNLVSVCSMDISAGFDTVPHNYLLRKLEMFGYEDSALAWVDSSQWPRHHAVKPLYFDFSARILIMNVKKFQSSLNCHRQEFFM